MTNLLINPYGFTSLVNQRSYWRVQLVAAQNTLIRWGDLVFAASPGGAQLATGGTPTVSSSSAGSAAGAFDNDGGSTVNQFLDQYVAGQWAQYFRPTPFAAAEFRLRAAVTTPNTTGSAWAILVSDDGVTWRGVRIIRDATVFTSGQERAYTLGNTLINNTLPNAVLWGIDITATGGFASPAFVEMVFATSSGGATICTGGQAFHSHAPFPANMSGLLFDGGTATPNYWVGRTMAGDPVQSVGYLFATPPTTQPTYLRITADTAFPTAAPTAFSVWWSADGFNKTTVGTFSTSTFTSGQTKEFSW